MRRVTKMKPATDPTCYLSSLETDLFGVTRSCTFGKRVHFDTNKEAVWVELEPGVEGAKLGETGIITRFLLASRHFSQIHSIPEFPCFVFICRPRIASLEARDVIHKDELTIVAWGELYRSKHDADHHVFG